MSAGTVDWKAMAYEFAELVAKLPVNERVIAEDDRGFAGDIVNQYIDQFTRCPDCGNLAATHSDDHPCPNPPHLDPRD